MLHILIFDHLGKNNHTLLLITETKQMPVKYDMVFQLLFLEVSYIQILSTELETISRIMLHCPL